MPHCATDYTVSFHCGVMVSYSLQIVKSTWHYLAVNLRPISISVYTDESRQLTFYQWSLKTTSPIEDITSSFSAYTRFICWVALSSLTLWLFGMLSLFSCPETEEQHSNCVRHHTVKSCLSSWVKQHRNIDIPYFPSFRWHFEGPASKTNLNDWCITLQNSLEQHHRSAHEVVQWLNCYRLFSNKEYLISHWNQLNKILMYNT